MVVHRRSLSPLLVALLAAPAACDSDQGDERLPPRPRADATRACDTHIEGRLPAFDPRRDFAAGAVRFRGFRSTSRFAAREPRGFFRSKDGEYGGLKFVTEVRAGVGVTAAIAPESRDRAAMLYGNEEIEYGRFGIPFDEGEQAVRFEACSAGRPAFAPRFYHRRTVGPWTQFNGGFLLTGPQCLRLDVYVAGQAARRYAEPFGFRSGSSLAAKCRSRID